MATWNTDEVDRIGTAEEVRVAARRLDGRLRTGGRRGEIGLSLGEVLRDDGMVTSTWAEKAGDSGPLVRAARRSKPGGRM